MGGEGERGNKRRQIKPFELVVPVSSVDALGQD